MRIPLERESKTPLYLQIERYLRKAITAGKIPVQTQLPAARRLALDLGISRMTVETAYEGLEADGLVRREMGSGTFVLPSPSVFADRPAAGKPVPSPWQHDLQAACHDWHHPSEAGERPLDVSRNEISFAVGVGDSRRFPVEEFRKTIRTVLRKEGRSALEYGDPRGYPPLRQRIAHLLSTQGLQTSAESVLITSGSQQALALVIQLLLRAGDCILVERPTYAAGLDLFRAMGLRIAEVPVDRDGMQVETLEPLLQRYHPRLIYTIPNFQNPTGSCMTVVRRRKLITLAQRYNIPIVEDDFVGDLRYDGRAQPPLKALDASGDVLYVSTFSKMLMPGLRAGFLVADGPVGELLSGLKRLTDLATSNIIQRGLDSFVSIGRYEAHLRRSSRAYQKRRDAMALAVERYFPAGTEMDLPSGGLFLWVRLPSGISTSRLLPRAGKAGVSFAPGRDFFADGKSGDEAMRLNFAAFTPDEIEEGMRRLGRVLTGAER